MESLKANTIASEGFSPKPYIDVLVLRNPEEHGISFLEMETIKKHLATLKLTFGYGFTSISEDEAEAVIEVKLKKIIKQFERREPFINKLPFEAQNILVEMSYQMGVSGVLGFHDMWRYLKLGDYKSASMAMLDSKFARQMHGADMIDGVDSIDRAERLAFRMGVIDA